MTPIDIGGIIVAVVAALGAWASQRAASKASTVNTLVNARLDAEKDAYERARNFDLETIKRQETELIELRTVVRELKDRLARLEDKTPLSIVGLEGLLGERLKKEPKDDQEQ